MVSQKVVPYETELHYQYFFQLNESEGMLTRIKYLDGLRGIACLQVLFLHVFLCYAPQLAEYHENAIGSASSVQNSPLFFLYDGFAGVYIFFYISGYVLTSAFEGFRSRWLDEVQARIVRLWVPTIIFGVFALLCFLIFQQSHGALAAINGSGTLGHCWNVKSSVLGLFRDILINPVFIGYKNNPLVGLFPGLESYLTDSGDALNSPVWSMSAELQGSVLVLLLVYLRDRAPVLWCTAIAFVVALFPLPYIVFALGNLAAVLRLGERKYKGLSRVMPWIAILLLVAGIEIAWPHRSGPYLLIGTGMIFLGVLNSRICQAVLSQPIFLRLGNLSLTIYLVHWAIVFGPGAWFVLKMVPLIGLEESQVFGTIVAVSAVLFLSARLVVFDKFAVSMSHAVKRRDLSSVRNVFGK